MLSVVPVVRACGLALSVWIGLYAAYFSLFTCALHESFASAAYDLGTFDQGIWLAGRGDSLFVTVRGLHLLGDHVRLISFALAPLYLAIDDVRALLVAQSVAIAMGAWLIWRIGLLTVPNHPVAVLALAASYLLNPAVQNLNLDHAHPDAFAATFLLAAIYFLRTNRLLLFGAATILALACKEDVPLTFMALGVSLIITSQHRAFGILLASAAAAYFVACLFVVLPHFNGVGFFRFEYGGFLFGLEDHWSDPEWLFRRLSGSESRTYLLALGAPVGFLPVLAPFSLVAALPALMINTLADAGYLRDLRFHYQALIVPILYVAAVDGIARIVLLERRIGESRLRALMSYAIPIFILLCVVPANAAWSRVPLRNLGQIQSLLKTARTDPEVRNLRHLLLQIPERASVSADYTIVPHLTHRDRVYVLPNPYRPLNWGIHGENPHDPSSVEYVVFREEILLKEELELVGELVSQRRLELAATLGSARLYRRVSTIASRATTSVVIRPSGLQPRGTASPAELEGGADAFSDRTERRRLLPLPVWRDLTSTATAMPEIPAAVRFRASLLWTPVCDRPAPRCE